MQISLRCTATIERAALIKSSNEEAIDQMVEGDARATAGCTSRHRDGLDEPDVDCATVAFPACNSASQRCAVGRSGND